ncbi:hypothetical protein CTI12_AA448460 [Artemisia annua]|uniref:CCHC-type domain-containing protein n=1 Tax=Artemisia annua TaxID=35608 RepID=A0A2U1LVY4_ARTAN|nr:hypothetical protein CTI12_AA448460 [Artemisia annua]
MIEDPNNKKEKRLQTEDDLNQDELAQFEADICAKNLILYGLSNDIYNAIDSNLTAHDLWKALERLMQGADVGTQTQQTLALWNYQSFKQLPEESLEDAYIRFNKLINEMNRHNLKRSNIKHNTMFLTNLQPEWRPLVSSYHQNQQPFHSSNDSPYSQMDDSNDPNQDQATVELTKIVQNLALLGKQIQKSFYKCPTNKNLRTTSAPTALNKRQDMPPRGEMIRQGAQKIEKNDAGQDNQEPKCFGCGQQGHIAKNCPNGKVRNREKGKLLSADENDFMMDTYDEGELLETNMVYMASLEKMDIFEAQEEEAIPSYDTDAENDDSLVNKVHTSDACDYDALDELIHGHPHKINKSIAVTTCSEISTRDNTQLHTNSIESNHASTSQDHTDMLQNYANIQSRIANYADLIKLEKYKSASLEKKIKDMLYEEKSERPLVLKCKIQDLQNEIFSFKRNISSIEKSKKNLEIEVLKLKEDKANCILRLTRAETKLRTDLQTTQTMNILLPKPDPLMDLTQGLCYTKPSYLEMAKRQLPSLHNNDYMRRDTFKDYMFNPPHIDKEEIQKHLNVKQKKTNFSYFSADYNLINKQNVLSRKQTNVEKHVDQVTDNTYDSSKYESLARKNFCRLRHQINSSLNIIRKKQEFQIN